MSVSVSIYGYQKEAIFELWNNFQAGHRGQILCLPAGGGKTTTAGFFCHRALESEAFAEMLRTVYELTPSKKILIFMSGKHLVSQFANRLKNQFGMNVGVVMAKVRPKYSRPIQIASIETLYRRLAKDSKYAVEIKRMLNPDLIFIDECHHVKASTYLQVLDSFPEKLLIGLTATPFRYSRNNGIGFTEKKEVIFSKIVKPTSVDKLIEEGKLVDFDWLAPADEADLSKYKKRKGEYSDSDQREAFGEARVRSGVLKAYLEQGRARGPALCFNVDRSVAMDMHELFLAKGIRSAYMDGKTSLEDREKYVKMLEDGRLEIIHAVRVGCEGMDIPKLKVLILNVAVCSLNMYIQMVMRVMRASPGKGTALFIDAGGNFNRHGHPGDVDDGDYVLTAKPKKKKNEEEEVSPVKICGKCGFVNRKSRRECKRCGGLLVIPRIKEEMDIIENETGYVLLEADVIRQNRFRDMPSMSVTKEDFPVADIGLFAAAKGYKSMYVAHQVAERLGIEKTEGYGWTREAWAMLQMEMAESGQADLFEYTRAQLKANDRKSKR